MDAKVLEAQQWVNQTYGWVGGYDACPEDGKTGWLTMYSLTMALQFELGITALSANFGPATLAALNTRGGVRVTETNSNAVRIVQCGCYCKGYEPGGITGNFTATTRAGVSEMMQDAGIGSLGAAMPPKAVKALLTMDAYVAVGNGTEEIRSIQRWLNGRYWSHRDFYVIPCDGNYSRDIQKAMLLAIQFELGMSDDQATGVFGPGTQAGIRQHTVRLNSTGVWVQLFSAAMVFNSYGSYGSTFTAGLQASVRSFQSFSALPPNGEGDFATWAQLLVSTGDPNRPGTAADCITTVTPARAAALFNAGYRVIGRYLDEHGNALNKKIQPGELATIFAAGLKVFPISQYYGGERDYFTYQQGLADARGAHAAAVGHGFGTNTVIYFAVDYDASQDEIDSNIVPYFRGVAGALSSLGRRFVHGVYGSRNVCAEVTRQTGAIWSFVSGMSTGFSGNMGFSLPANWVLNQVQTRTVGSGAGAIEIDHNVCRPGFDPFVGTTGGGPSSSVTQVVNGITGVHGLARDYAGSAGPLDRLVLEYLRRTDYNSLKWYLFIGYSDADFCSYVNDTAIRVPREYVDPSGITVTSSHFGAACNGHVVKGLPVNGVNQGDFTAWGGDLITFYAEWQRETTQGSTGRQYCLDHLFRDDDSTFTISDLISDADAYNTAVAILNGTDVAAVVRGDLQGGGWQTRFSRFYNGRFGGTNGGAAAAAKNMLMNKDPLMLIARDNLIKNGGGEDPVLPSELSDADLNGFCDGFAEALSARVAEEASR